MHYFLKHPTVTLILIALLSFVSGLTGSTIFLLAISHNISAVSASGTWAIGLFAAIAAFYYFKVDTKRDIEIYCKLTSVDYKRQMVLQAFNNSRIGNVVTLKDFYVSSKHPADSPINHHDSNGEIKLKHLLNQGINYMPLQPYGITAEIYIPWEELCKQIAYALHMQKIKAPVNSCCLTITFADVKDDPYRFYFPFSLDDTEDYIEDINKELASLNNQTLSDSNPADVTEEKISE